MPTSNEFETAGRLWIRGALSAKTVARLSGLMSDRSMPGNRIELSEHVTDLLGSVASESGIHQLWPTAVPVRAVGFQKDETANWGLGWHQDRVISVKERAEIDGFGNWSREKGVWHCEPPHSFLETMLFTRVFLDKGRHDNGGMEFAVGSHREGLVRSAEAGEVAQRYNFETEAGGPGDVLVLKMLTLYRSSPSRSTVPRRVVRLDFATSPLPPPLEWK